MVTKAQRDEVGPAHASASRALASLDASAPRMVTSKERESTGKPMEPHPTKNKLAKRASTEANGAQQPPTKAARLAPQNAEEPGPCKGVPFKTNNVSDEIDDLFGKLKSSIKGKSKPEKEAEHAAPAAAAVQGSKDDLFGTDQQKTRKRTEEGYAIYNEEELGFGRKNAGGTDLCPFDCQCCF